MKKYSSIAFIMIIILFGSCKPDPNKVVYQLDTLVEGASRNSDDLTYAQQQAIAGQYNSMIAGLSKNYNRLSLANRDKVYEDSEEFCLIAEDFSVEGLKVYRMSRDGSISFTSSSSSQSTSQTATAGPSNSSSKEMSGEELFAKCSPAVFVVTNETSEGYMMGSGFFISPDGLAVSNYHVFKGGLKGHESIKLQDGSSFKLKSVIAKGNVDNDNTNADYFLFYVDIGNRSVPYIPVSKRPVKIGQKAYAIGSPQGLENTFSSGEISQVREDEGGNFFQISVPIDHGSSGGALINQYGEVVGITSSGIESSGANLNFAVDIHVLDKYLN